MGQAVHVIKTHVYEDSQEKTKKEIQFDCSSICFLIFDQKPWVWSGPIRRFLCNRYELKRSKLCNFRNFVSFSFSNKVNKKGVKMQKTGILRWAYMSNLLVELLSDVSDCIHNNITILQCCLEKPINRLVTAFHTYCFYVSIVSMIFRSIMLTAKVWLAW